MKISQLQPQNAKALNKQKASLKEYLIIYSSLIVKVEYTIFHYT